MYIYNKYEIYYKIYYDKATRGLLVVHSISILLEGGGEIVNQRYAVIVIDRTYTINSVESFN